MLKKIISSFYISFLKRRQKLNIIQIDKPAYVHYSATFSFQKNISLGKYTRIGRACHIDGEGGVAIGDGSILAPRVVILTSSHKYRDASSLPYGIEDEKAPVIIGKGCWIGWGAMIKPGVTIGDGAIIAMGSVVVNDVNKGEIAGGNPAKVINKRPDAQNIEQMIAEEKYFLKEVLGKKLVREGREDNIYDQLIQ